MFGPAGLLLGAFGAGLERDWLLTLVGIEALIGAEVMLVMEETLRQMGLKAVGEVLEDGGDGDGDALSSSAGKCGGHLGLCSLNIRSS